jgi:hypothetical protein
MNSKNAREKVRKRFNADFFQAINSIYGHASLAFPSA